MLDEGAGTRTAIEVNDALARIGAGFDTEVGPDATFLTLTTLARFRRPGLGLLSDLVAAAAIRAGTSSSASGSCARNRLRQLRDLPPARGRPRLRGAAVRRASLRPPRDRHGTGPLVDLARGRPHVPPRARTARRTPTLIAVGDAIANDLASAGRRLRQLADAALPATVQDGDAAALDRRRRPRGSTIVRRPGAAQSELQDRARGRRALDPRLSRARAAQHGRSAASSSSRINMNLREDKGYTYGARTVVRLPPRPRSVLAAGERADRRDRRRHPRGAGRDGGDPRRPADRASGARSSLGQRSRAGTRGTSRPANRSPGPAPSWPSTICPTTTSSDSSRPAPGLGVDDIGRVAGRRLDPSRLATLVVGDGAPSRRLSTPSGSARRRRPQPVRVTPTGPGPSEFAGGASLSKRIGRPIV